MRLSRSDAEELRGLVGDLRAEGSDVADVEVKRAAKDFPKSVAETLSAFANTPGGGLIVFGLDEGSGFAASGVYDPAACKVSSISRERTSKGRTPLPN